MGTQCLGPWHIKARVVSGLEKDTGGGRKEKEIKLVLCEVMDVYDIFSHSDACLLYTSDAADDVSWV